MTRIDGYIYGIGFRIEDPNTVVIYMPESVLKDDFRPKCDRIVKYIIDEGFLKNKRCKVKIVKLV